MYVKTFSYKNHSFRRIWMNLPVENHKPFQSRERKIVIIESYDNPYYHLLHKKNKRKVYPNRMSIEKKYLLQSEDENPLEIPMKSRSIFFFFSCFSCLC
jgi:hypothetical protein